MKTIGIVGGGQLGRMLTLAALPLGFKVVVINPAPDSPAAQAGAQEIVGDLYDLAALQTLAEKADCVTVEIEHLDAEALEKVAATGIPVHPAPSTIRLIQDKFKQKQFLQSHGIPVAPFEVINSKSDAFNLLKKFKGKMLLKTRFGAYDGRGNRLIKNKRQLEKALKDFTGRPLYAEAFVPFKKELAVMVARSASGAVATYPIVETIHKRNICVEVLAPARITPSQRHHAQSLASKVATLLEGAGVFGIEMFLTDRGKVLINEIAPRVHNSGHYTMEASRTSQFEQHVRAVADLPLGKTDLLVPAAVMINILGERDGDTEIKGLAEALAIPHTSVHLYGKSPTKIDRKMGHITVTGHQLEKVRSQAHKARKLFSI